MSNGQRKCGTPMIWAAEKEEDDLRKAQMTPQQYQQYWLQESNRLRSLLCNPSSTQTEPAATVVAASPSQATDARRNESGIRPAFQQALDRARIDAEKPKTREEMRAIADRFYGTKRASSSE